MTLADSTTPDEAMAAAFALGLIVGFFQNNELYDIAACPVDWIDVAVDVKDIIEFFDMKDFPDFVKGIKILGELLADLPNYVKDCDQSENDK